MKYNKREIRELLDKGNHVLKIEHTEEFVELLKELYPKDNWFEMYTIKQVVGYYLIPSKTCINEWYWTDFILRRTVILFSEIEKDEVIWNGNDMQFLNSGKWHDCTSDAKYRLKPKKSDGELELERLAEELGYNLTKK